MASNELKYGGGSGGGDDGDNTLQTADGVYEIAANQVVLLTKPPTDPDPDSAPIPHVITILASGKFPTYDDGKVDIRGAKGVRITTGDPLVIPLDMSPPVTNESTNGVEIVVAADQSVTIQCGTGPFLPFDQKIQMTSDSMTLQSGGEVGTTIKMTSSSIKLSVGAPGTEINAITIDSNGVTIQGMMIKLLFADFPPAVHDDSITIVESGVTIKGMRIDLNLP